MKASELMVGDWVNLSKGNWSENRQVELIDIEMIAESVYLAEPIPLTEEILEKNGFKDGQYFAELYIQGWHVISDARNLCMECERGWHMNIPCRCVHELQHALRLCQIEKEIEL